MDITVKITEQPQAKALRFRYKCEGRSAGSLPGVRSTGENRTYPTIKVLNYKGPVFVVVSCVTVDAPFRPHPHNLVGRDCDKGVCTTRFESDSMECTFPNLGIQCVKKREVEETLEAREKIHVDPFGTGFAHKKQPQNLDLNAVRLCFQVFLVGANNEKGSQIPLKPVVSDPIYDKKATSDLNICKLSDCTSLVSGGKEIILLCDKVTKEDIQVKFTETKDEQVVWEALGDFQASDVHKQVAISFKTPKYSNLHVTHSVKVDIQLYRPSDGSKSEPRAFEYLPLEQGPSPKRLKPDDDGACGFDYSLSEHLFAYNRLGQGSNGRGTVINPTRPIMTTQRGPRVLASVKVEPPDGFQVPHTAYSVDQHISPNHYGGASVFQSVPPATFNQIPITSHMQSPIMYQPTSPVADNSVIKVPSPSPQTITPFCQISPGVQCYSPNQSPYSPSDYSPGNPAFSTSPDVLLPNHSAPVVAQSPELNIQYTLPPSIIDGENNLSLPELNVNSGDLNGGNCDFNNLSETFSGTLNISDISMSLRQHSKKSEEDKGSLNTPVHSESISSKQE